MKIRQNWPKRPILWLKKKDVIFSNISEGENIEEKTMSDFCYANFDPIYEPFVSFYPFFLLFMESTCRIKPFYFFRFPKQIWKKKGKKGYCGHFRHLADFVSHSQNPPNVQNGHSTPFLPYFWQKVLENLKSNKLLFYSAINSRKKG